MDTDCYCYWFQSEYKNEGIIILPKIRVICHRKHQWLRDSKLRCGRKKDKKVVEGLLK